MFTITKDHFAELDKKPGTNANAVGIVGPRGASLNHEQIVAHKGGKKFRMLDDDRVLIYEGVYVDAGGDEFEPLDCFGSPNFGCTIIQYWDHGWQDL